MSDFKPTPSQRAAIEARGSAVLVSAGAGSGKTRVLTERLMSYICDENAPAELDSFLIITFTRAAAAELRGRITRELAERLALDPGNKRLRRQSALVQRAQISTIHGFCTALLRENCHRIGLSPDFKIVDDERAAAMKAAALERVMDARYEAPERYKGFLALADTVGAGRDDRRLTALVLSLYEQMQCHARPDLWAAQQVELLRTPAEDVAELPCGKEILGWAAGITDYWIRSFDELISALPDDEKMQRAYLPCLSDTSDRLHELSRAIGLGWDSARRCLPVSLMRLGSVRDPFDPGFVELYKAKNKLLKKDLDTLARTFECASASLLHDMAQSADAMEALLSLTLDFEKAYAADKRRRALADYSDLEHMAAQLLTNEDNSPTELAVQLSRRYTEIMVDEYQDVSRVQEAIFGALSREGKNLFLVGDVKQSIYRFRLADPVIFTEKYRNYPDYTAAREGEPRRILLRENFRSRREILDCANSVFSLCMSEALGGINYDERAALVCSAGYDDSVPKPELSILDLSADRDDADERLDKTELEARLAAGHIRALMASGACVSENGVTRALNYGDIAILLRSANSVGDIYRRVLSEYGIPVDANQGSGFFLTVEISLMLSLLAVLDDPHQDIPLIAVLRSACFGFTADELAMIRSADTDADFYTALCTAAETDEKCRGFLARLSALRSVAPDLGAAELTWQLINELDLLSLCSAMSDGEQRRANLLEFIELSERFEAAGYRGVHHFVLWLRRLSERGAEISAGAVRASCVQIMSIHRSKGLEFPVVLLCDTARQFNLRDSMAAVLVHPVLGLGPKYSDLALRVEYPTLARNAIKLRQKSETFSEELRLLYVAMTRAKERLIMTGVMKNAEKELDEHRLRLNIPMAPEDLRAGSMLDWLVYSALADKGRTMTMRCVSSAFDAVAEQAAAQPSEPDMAAMEELTRRLSFKYAYEAAVSLPSKVTATELKGRSEPDADASELLPASPTRFRMPDLARVDRPLTGAERGVATHLVLQYMDFSPSMTRAFISSEVERLCSLRFITPREAEAVDVRAIERLFSSPIGRRILSADKLRREFKFSVLCPAERLFPDVGNEELLLQGVIDCCIEEPDGLTIIDYKTDRVRTDEEIAARSAHYRGQLNAYAEAMERITGKTVKECVLYYLSAGCAVTL